MKLLFILAIVIQATIISSAGVSDGGVYKIKPKGSGTVVGIKDSSTAVGADLVAQVGDGSDFQKFRFHQANQQETFYIEVLGSGLYLSNYISPPRQANFNPDAFYQDYEIIPAAGGYYMIRPVANAGSVMTLSNDGTSFSWQPKTGADNQLFYFCTATETQALKSASLKLSSLSVEEDNESYEGLDLKG